MGELGLLVLAGIGTALATGLGAIPVFALGRRADALRPLLWGLAAGVMAVASVVGLLAPALDEGSTAAVAAGLLAGVAVPARRAATAGRPRRPRRRAARRRRAPLRARLRRAARPQPARGLRDRRRVRVGASRVSACSSCSRSRCRTCPREPTSAIPMRDAGFPRRSSSGPPWRRARRSRSAPSIAYILVEEIDEPAAGLVRVRRRGDARARRARARAAGLHERTWRDGARRRGRRIGPHARAQRRDRRLNRAENYGGGSALRSDGATRLADLVSPYDRRTSSSPAAAWPPWRR